MAKIRSFQRLRQLLQKECNNTSLTVEWSKPSTIWAGAAGSVKAIAIAGDQPSAVGKVAQIVEDFGFEPLLIGSLAKGIMLEPGSPLFGANETAEKLQGLVDIFAHSEKGQAFYGQRA